VLFLEAAVRSAALFIVRGEAMGGLGRQRTEHIPSWGRCQVGNVIVAVSAVVPVMVIVTWMMMMMSA
jgi:hypothetical protein